MNTTRANVGLIALAAAVLGGVVTAAAQQPGPAAGGSSPAAAGPAGRFVPIIDKGGFLCLVDTGTGECWSHSVGTGQDGKRTEVWHPLGSPAAAKRP